MFEFSSLLVLGAIASSFFLPKNWGCRAARDVKFAEILEQRLKSLEYFATNTASTNKCNGGLGYLVLRRDFGRLNNHFVQIVHGIWLADQLNRTLVVPQTMSESFSPFRLDKLKSQFCFKFEKDLNMAAAAVVTTQRFLKYGLVQAHYSFFLDELIFDKRQIERLNIPVPAFGDTNEIISSISMHFMRFYALLWSQASDELIQHTIDFVETHLGGGTGYISVHKRQFEGGCSHHLFTATTPWDYPPGQVPISSAHQLPNGTWNDSVAHPLCTMSSSFVRDVMVMHGLSPHGERQMDTPRPQHGPPSKSEQQRGRPESGVMGQKKRHRVFVAHDGQTSIDDLRADLGAVDSNAPTVGALSSVPVPGSHTQPTHSTNYSATHMRSPSSARSAVAHTYAHRSHLDMMVAIHGDLFVMNPRSTFSWTVFVVRTALGLPSVPVLRGADNNMFLREGPKRSWSCDNVHSQNTRRAVDFDGGDVQNSKGGGDGDDGCQWVSWRSVARVVAALRDGHGHGHGERKWDHS